MSLHLARCSSVAWSNLGNQASGTITRRPSASSTDRSSSVKDTSTARGSTLGSEVVIPSLKELLAMLLDLSLKAPKVRRAEPSRGGQGYHSEPELGDGTAPLDVDVRRLRPLVGVEKDPRGAEPEDGWHRRTIVPAPLRAPKRQERRPLRRSNVFGAHPRAPGWGRSSAAAAGY